MGCVTFWGQNSLSLGLLHLIRTLPLSKCFWLMMLGGLSHACHQMNLGPKVTFFPLSCPSTVMIME